MARKLIGAALLVVAFCWAGTSAQPEVPEEDDQQLVTRTHSLEGIPVVGAEDIVMDKLLPEPRILEIESDGRGGPASIFGPPVWNSTRATDLRSPLGAEGIANQLERLLHHHQRGWLYSKESGPTFEGTPDTHQLIEWYLDQLRAYYAQRIQFSVFELKDAIRSGTVPAEQARELRRGAALLATRTAHSREVAVVSTLRSLDYTADYEVNVATSASMAAPVVDRMHIGAEMALSACPAPDGSILVRAVRGRSTLQAMRKYDGPEGTGVLELPDFTWTSEEGGVRLRQGESWVFGDRYLISATATKPWTGARHPTRPIAVLSPDMLYKRQSADCGVAPGDLPGRATYPSYVWRGAPEGPAPAREAHSWPDTPEKALAPELLAHLQRSGASVRCLGPLICLTWDEEANPERTAMDTRQPAAIHLQTRRWHVTRDFEIADNLLQGTPSEDSLGRLGKPLYDRQLCQLESGRIEDSQLSFSNYVARFDTNVATGIGVFDPIVRSLISGTRLAIELGKEGPRGVPVDVLYGFAPPGEIKTSQAGIPGRAVSQTATISATAMRLSGTLGVGESISAITPVPDNPNLLIVVAVTRVEP